ncbi:MAG TPA: nitrilase-related carbon-nitrogen hydrolase [Elusimicrobiales bacterium]|nr:nitrilase-related carbon-nitrogen hydrolase [Elusimicrobiales bacterium]
MKIALCQFDMVWENRQANKDKIAAMLEKCPDKEGVDWLILPEMTLSGFSMNTEAATIDDKDTAFFSELAKKYSLNISYGAIQNGHNNLITVNKQGETVSCYSKIHLYSFAGEAKHYRYGETQQTFELDGLRVTPAVCFDLRFPYLFWNAAEKTDIFVVIASWPAQRAEHWMTLLRARAVENQCYVAGVNRTGKDPFLPYSGNSMIFDPLGKVVADAKDIEGITVAQIDVNKELVTKTRTRFPFFNDKKKSPPHMFA